MTKRTRTRRQKLVDKLDNVFSEYIRLRDCVKTTGTVDRCACISCGKPCCGHLLHCWHFVTRWHKSVRWEEKNANWQCCACNTFNAGEQYKHWKAIDRKYGEWTADRLVAMWNQTKKWTLDDLEWMIITFKNKKTEILNKLYNFI